MEKIIEYFKGDDLAASSWNNKYRLNNETIEEFFNRISSQFLDLDNFPERDPSHKNIDDLSEYGKKRYLMGRYERKSLMKTFFGSFDYIIPGGSALSGLGSKKPVSLSNCFVVASPDDTIVIQDILESSVSPTARLSMLKQRLENNPATFIKTPERFSTRTEYNLFICIPLF